MSSEDLPPQPSTDVPRAPIHKVAFVFSYDGTQYCGWQQQGPASGGSNSIQEVFERTLQSIVSEPATLSASGRTDSGVHAAAQVAHTTLRKRAWDPRILVEALNSRLPLDIRVLKAIPVPPEFQAQKGAAKKQYSYYYGQGPCALPHLLAYAQWNRKKLDVAAMNRAVQDLIGEHDFKSFQATGSKVRGSVRRILEADVTVVPITHPQAPESCFMVRIRLVGTGFLKQMVRGIAGTLLQVGEGRRPADCMPEILASMSRSSIGPTAPSRGLWLERVWYKAPFEDIGP